MPHKPREIESILKNKFHFIPTEGHSPDHRWYEIRLPDLPPILTKISHSKKRDIGRKLEGKIARQLRVRTAYFRGMVDCTHSCEDYYRQVRDDPYPPFEHRF